jgi:chromosome partition protein MukB
VSLLRARDALDGELLATQFEELTVEQASEIEALLGPLAHALVVDDPAAAADSLCDIDDAPDSVWLVGGDASPVIDVDGRPDGAVHDGCAIVNGGTSWRVSRIPERPTLGRRARARRIRDLREEAESFTRHIEQCDADLREVASQMHTVNGLLTEADALEHGDPSGELNRVTKTLATTTTVEQDHRQAAAQTATEVVSMKARRTALQELLPTAWLLDEPDQQQRLHKLKEKQDEAKAAAERLQDVAEHRSVIESQMDVLRTPPMSPTDIAAMQERKEALDHEQDTRLEALECLRYVVEHRVALTWTDASAALKREVALEPALEQQLEQARTAAQSTQAAVDDADTALDAANQTFNKIDAQVQQLAEAIKRDEEEWRACEVDSATDEDVRRAGDAVTEAEITDKELKSKARSIGEEIARLDERRKAAATSATQRRNERDEAERGWRPNQDRWDKLEALATEHGVLSSAMTRRFVDMFGGRGSANVRSDAKEAAARLKERLSHASDSSDVESAVNELLGTQELAGESCLEAWLAVRDWLKRRIPAQIAEVAEPVEALERLRRHLDGLEERLGRQEADLRGESSDVAKNIDIHIRRAQRQISKLNHDLGDVRFGSIHGVRLRLERVERMDQILHALRDGEAQSLLFQPDMPIETALDELFRRYGGGGRTTGQRLLDYREYIEPKVEVRRQSSEHWEVANPTRMSTGEAIGVGAALMMVVLTAWERDANLLRPKRSHGTLRLLFLDEANRLSQDNLSVLFDLCQSLDLQLIIAAPEVAQAQGNTTYRLVRRLTESGDEEVVVTGRRLATERQV